MCESVGLSNHSSENHHCRFGRYYLNDSCRRDTWFNWYQNTDLTPAAALMMSIICARISS